MSALPAVCSDVSYGRTVPLPSPRWSNVHTLVTLCSLIYLLQFVAHVASGNATTFEDDSFDGTRGVLTDLLSLLVTCVGTTLLLKGWFPGPSSWRASARRLDSTKMVLALNSFVETCNFFMDNQLRYGHVRANLWRTPVHVSRVRIVSREDEAGSLVKLSLVDHCPFDDAFWKEGTKLQLQFRRQVEVSIQTVDHNNDPTHASARSVNVVLPDSALSDLTGEEHVRTGSEYTPVARTTLRAVERQGGGLSLLRTLGYLIDPEVVCKASLVVVLSSMTCYVLSDLVAGVVRERVASRYVGLVAFAVTGVLASIPTNTVRFGWAYRSRRDETVRTGLVVLVYTLTSVVYMTYTSTDDRSRDQAEVRREKLALVTSSLFFIVLYDTLSSADASSDGGDDGRGAVAPRSCAKHFVRYLVPLDEGLDPLRLVVVLCTGMLPYMILSAFLRPGWRSILYLTDTGR